MVEGNNHDLDMDRIHECDHSVLLIGSTHSRFCWVCQEGSVKEFHEIFEMYSRPLKITERRYLFGLFLTGLKDDVRAELKFHSFHTLDELIDIAKMVESHNKML